MERAGNEELTEDTEKKGLGTPATRAAIIEKLIQSGFVKREKKNLVPTDDGNVLITVLPDEIKSPKMTAEWEYRTDAGTGCQVSGYFRREEKSVSGKGKRRSHWQMSPLWSRCPGRKSKLLLF